MSHKYEVQVNQEFDSWSDNYTYQVVLYSVYQDNAVVLEDFSLRDSDARKYAHDVYAMFEPADCRYVDNSY